MKRQIVYSGSIPLDSDLLNTNRNTMVAIAKVAAAMLGTATTINGLACSPTSPASMQVQVAPGEIYSLANLDGTAYGSLEADTTHQILKQGILLDSTLLSCPAPTTSGFSVNYLIEATYQDLDSDALVLPYYNSANPSQAFSGADNDGVAQNTTRDGVCSLQVKAGIAATTGSQITPSVDSGYTGLYVVTVSYGQTSISASNISTISGAPFIAETLTEKISKTTADGLYTTSAQVQQLIQEYAVQAVQLSGSGNAFTGALVPEITSNASLGEPVTVYFPSAITGAATINLGGGATALVDAQGNAFSATNTVPSGASIVQYNASLSKFQVLGLGGIDQVARNAAAKVASDTAAGIVELATSAEVIAGADTERAVTPAGLASALSNVIMRGLFKKDSPRTRLFNPTTSTTLSTTSKLWVEVNGTMQSFIAGTSVVMPSLTAGSDYAIYACTDGTLRADSNFSAPTGYTTLTSRFIGSAHYAPGGNATAQSGGNTTPAFNPYSCFDLTYRPSRTDWRGMTTDPGLSVCGMIYLLNTDPAANGASKYNVTMADGSSPPKIPTQFGGNGSTSYSSFNWWEAREILAANGMRLPSYGEFSALTYGTTEASSIGADQVSTILNAAYTSKCGIIQATGVLWTWGDEFGGGAVAAGWTANTGGRGSTYQMENAVVFGGDWAAGALSGSRCSGWADSPTASTNNVGARGVCDLLILD